MNDAVRMGGQLPRVLFIAEAVSLAHVTRPLVLAKALDPQAWDVHFACADGYDFCLGEFKGPKHALHSILPPTFLDRLAAGRPLYTTNELLAYVEEDSTLLAALAPDVVVGDFRLSLAVSARLHEIPYVALTNAHWSPFAKLTRFPFPEHPLASVLGVPLASWLFHRIQPLVLASHARPMNAVRKRFGLKPIPDLRQLYTDGDWTLYADTPTLIPTDDLPSNHRYIGPLLWSPAMSPPPWWHEIPDDRPTVYVTLGSTGEVTLLPELVSTLSALDVSVLVATAGRLRLDHLPPNVWAAEYLPGSAAAARSSVVVCSGGSATTYQALALGRPVIGICSNMDQYLTMHYVEAAGAGMKLRAGKVAAAQLKRAIEATLQQASYTESARRIQADFAELVATERFAQVLAQAARMARDPVIATTVI